ncbi:MAG: ASCH domain-containing protein [Chloracidobacterium sp.]|nr:ASCH domain-containing protein [Chloracidobacterium sp.]
MGYSVEEFWAESCGVTGVGPDEPYQVWYFGNESDQAQTLAKLVLSGKKIATASLVETNLLEPEKAPIDGGYSVITSFEGEPICVVRTTEIRNLPFSDVDVDFAFDEGEDDQTLESWREGHWAYFSRESAELGFHFDGNSIVCCERFTLLYPR